MHVRVGGTVVETTCDEALHLQMQDKRFITIVFQVLFAFICQFQVVC
jgi:hypothetical protein